jgi:hypothetical protein
MNNSVKSPGSRGRNAGLLIFVSAIVWSFVAPWFTANNLIQSIHEMISYEGGCVAVLFGGWVYARNANPGLRLKAIICITIVCGLVIVVTSCLDSDKRFMFWKRRVISPSAWQQMVSDLKALAKAENAKNTNGFMPIHRDQLPKSFDALALPGEPGGGNTRTGDNPYVIYGTKGRRWGLAIGSNYFNGGNRVNYERVNVYDDAYFFAGPDY